MHTLLIFIDSDCEKKLRVMRRVKISIIFYICNKLSKYLLHLCIPSSTNHVCNKDATPTSKTTI